MIAWAHTLRAMFAVKVAARVVGAETPLYRALLRVSMCA
jgi:hypothetical protein